jgi:hypothetical protein
MYLTITGSYDIFGSVTRLDFDEVGLGGRACVGQNALV